MEVWLLRGMAFVPRIGLHHHKNTIGMVSLMLHLLLPFPFSIVKALGTDLGSLKIALESAYESWGTCMPLKVVGWSGSMSVGGSVCSGLLSSVSFSTCK